MDYTCFTKVHASDADAAVVDYTCFTKVHASDADAAVVDYTCFTKVHASDAAAVVDYTCFTKVSCVLHSSSGLDKSRTRTTDMLLASGLWKRQHEVTVYELHKLAFS